MNTQLAALLPRALASCQWAEERSRDRAVALDARVLGPGMVGLTLGDGIYFCDGYFANRLVSHECRHVHQYESAGSISDFLPLYLRQIAEFGYAKAPYEMDARNHKIDIAPKGHRTQAEVDRIIFSRVQVASCPEAPSVDTLHV